MSVFKMQIFNVSFKPTSKMKWKIVRSEFLISHLGLSSRRLYRLSHSRPRLDLSSYQLPAFNRSSFSIYSLSSSPKSLNLQSSLLLRSLRSSLRRFGRVSEEDMGEPICMTLVVAAGNKILQKKGTVIFFFTFFRKHETLNLLYELGLEVGKASNSDGFKSLETLPSSTIAATATEPSSSKALLQFFVDLCALSHCMRGQSPYQLSFPSLLVYPFQIVNRIKKLRKKVALEPIDTVEVAEESYFYMLQEQEAHAAEFERTFIAIKPDGVQRGLFWVLLHIPIAAIDPSNHPQTLLHCAIKGVITKQMTAIEEMVASEYN
uniref:Uncharacterized protein n=1 Tax=Cucumis melo TaxID=3656 RepID=A0A9I9E9R5_CUCME